MLHNIFILDLCSTFIVKMFTDQDKTIKVTGQNQQIPTCTVCVMFNMKSKRSPSFTKPERQNNRAEILNIEDTDIFKYDVNRVFTKSENNCGRTNMI